MSSGAVEMMERSSASGGFQQGSAQYTSGFQQGVPQYMCSFQPGVPQHMSASQQGTQQVSGGFQQQASGAVVTSSGQYYSCGPVLEQRKYSTTETSTSAPMIHQNASYSTRSKGVSGGVLAGGVSAGSMLTGSKTGTFSGSVSGAPSASAMLSGGAGSARYQTTTTREVGPAYQSTTTTTNYENAPASGSYSVGFSNGYSAGMGGAGYQQQTGSTYQTTNATPITNASRTSRTVNASTSVGGGSGGAMTSSLGTTNMSTSTARHASAQMMSASVGQYSGNVTSRKGAEVVVGYNTYVDESRTVVVGERMTEHEVRVPKKVVREDVIERTYIVPEKVITEEMMEEVVKIRQKIIEVQKPIIQERIVEVPEIIERERIVEVPEFIQQEKIVEVPKIEYVERLIEVPGKTQYVEKIVEVPEIVYRDVPVERIQDVVQYIEEVVYKEVPVPKYVDKPVPEYVTIEEKQDISRKIPVPVEAIITIDLLLPQLRKAYKTVEVPLYVPKFVEVPIPVDLMDEKALSTAESYASQVKRFAEFQQDGLMGGFLCELERIGAALKSVDLNSFVPATANDVSSLWQQAFMSGRLHVQNPQVLASAMSTMTAKTIDVNAIQSSGAVQQEFTSTTTTTTTTATSGVHGGIVGAVDSVTSRAAANMTAAAPLVAAVSTGATKVVSVASGVVGSLIGAVKPIGDTQTAAVEVTTTTAASNEKELKIDGVTSETVSSATGSLAKAAAALVKELSGMTVEEKNSVQQKKKIEEAKETSDSSTDDEGAAEAHRKN